MNHSFIQRPLTHAEARVLATLMEKARTVPDSYPLTLNSLQTGCNQKSSRDPVMNLSEAEIADALDSLREYSMVIESSGSRVTRYEHNFQRAAGVPEQSAALLGLLMLRGPQTAGELRINADRWYKFLDIGSVEAFLDELQARGEDKGGPLVVKLPRAPGAREARWAHRLCGPVDVSVPQASPVPEAGTADAELAARIERLEARVDELERLLRQAGRPDAPPQS
ncbi:MAG: YceH family protein [Hydrogenophaga sp.]